MPTDADPSAVHPTRRRFVDGEHVWTQLRDKVFEADHSHRCPTYVHSTPPCQAGCPAGEDVRGYLNVVRGIEKPPAAMPWQEYAWRRLTQANPFPSVMGRVCPAPCESGCNRNALEDHVGINSVEHFLGDWANARGLRFPRPEHSSGRKVAVVGGGPAGLSCAYQLALKGHAVTVFDEHEHLGGMMRYGIPGFRTPREALDAEIGRILELGVSTRLGCRVGADITLEALRREFDAVFLGMGAQAGRALPVADGEAPNVVTATAFLRAFNDGRLHHVGKRVVVVGGGDTSIDVATVARRLGHLAHAEPTDFEIPIGGQLAHDAADVSARNGAEVVLTSVLPIEQMQANRHEVRQALAEGISILGGLVPLSLVRAADGRASALRVARCEAKMAGGKLEVRAIEGTEEDLPADLIVCAIGQAVDFGGLASFDNGRGAITADRSGQVHGHPGVFAGGDVLRPHLLTTAIGHGAIAAAGIDDFLRGAEPAKRPKVDVHAFNLLHKYAELGWQPQAIDGPLRGTDVHADAIHNYDDRSDRYVIAHEQLFLGHFGFVARHRRKVLTLTRESALGNFEERIAALDETDAIAEAKRCMSCGLCFECDNCVVYCPQGAVKRVPKKQATTGRYVYTDYGRCIGCHVCADVCPTGFIQMGLGG